MTQFYKHPYIIQERASATDSKTRIQGSVTIEAALAIPWFLFAVLCLIYLLEIQAIQLSIFSAMQGTAKIAAEEMAVVQVLNPIKLKADLVNLIGAERLERSIVVGGSSGIRCWKSRYEEEGGELHVEIEYRLRLPFPGFVHAGVLRKEEMIVKAWNGYEKKGIESDDDQIVYVTENGLVYHMDYQCSYLQLTVRFVPYSGLEHLRNQDGGKYHACESCIYGPVVGGVYITDYGDKYHSSLNCNGLKRTIYSVKKGECTGMGACSRCGGR